MTRTTFDQVKKNATTRGKNQYPIILPVVQSVRIKSSFKIAREYLSRLLLYLAIILVFFTSCSYILASYYSPAVTPCDTANSSTNKTAVLMTFCIKACRYATMF